MSVMLTNRCSIKTFNCDRGVDAIPISETIIKLDEVRSHQLSDHICLRAFDENERYFESIKEDHLYLVLTQEMTRDEMDHENHEV